MTWTCKCDKVTNYDHEDKCSNCGADKPTGLSEEERAALAMVTEVRRAGRMYMSEPHPVTASEWSEWPVRVREQYVAMLRAARAPLEAELTKLREYHAQLAKDSDAVSGALADEVRKSQRLEARVRELEAQLAQAQKPAAIDRKRAMDAAYGAILSHVPIGEGSVGDVAEAVVGEIFKPVAPAGLPEVGQDVEIIQVGGRFVRDSVIKLERWGAEAAFRVSNHYGLFLVSKEGEEWRRIPPAQTSREPGLPKARFVVGYDKGDDVDRAAYVEMIQGLNGSTQIVRSLVGAEAEAEIARREAEKKPAASPPGEVSTQNFARELDSLSESAPARPNQALLYRGVEADIRAAVERETAKDKARIAELTGWLGNSERRLRDVIVERDAAVLKADRAERTRDAAQAEVERLKGEVERATQAQGGKPSP